MIQAIPANPFPHQTLSPSCIRRLPDGAVSVSTLGGDWVLQASQPLQAKFEELLERRKQGTLDAEESAEYEAICALDDALSWLNRLARGERKR
ncbi:MAG: hypothetical protein ACKV2Q_28185 [Planctomycetaceae bacterium]